MDRKKSFEEWKELVLSTSSKLWVPHANIVISLWFVDDKLLVADCQMVTTIKNLEENPSICIVADYYRICGNVEICTSWKYFDIAVKKSDGYTVKNTIVISINEVVDMDKSFKIK
jgi:hypothetical protein